MCKNTQMSSRLIEQIMCVYSKSYNNSNNCANNHMALIDGNESIDSGERWSGFTSLLCHLIVL